MKKLKAVFFGTPDFSVPSLDILFNHPEIELVSVVSMPDRKQGRGLELCSPEVIEFAKSKKITFFQTDNINKEDDFLNSLKDVDIFIVLAFAQFLSQKVLDIPKKGCFNIHTSLLPKYRGAAPIQYALLNGDTSTGVSIQKMVKKMDAGDIGHSVPVTIAPNETGGQLYTRLKFYAATALNDFITKLNKDDLCFEKQDEAKVSFAPTLKREDGFLDFENEKFETIFNKVRALYPWPGTYCYLNKKRLKTFNISESDKSLKPGEVNTEYNQLLIGCKDKSLRIEYLQLEGKKACNDSDLLNGLKGEITINPEGKK